MLSRRLLAAVAIAAMSATAALSAAAQEMPADQQKAMEAYAKVMSPNENHAFLKNFAGEWNTESKAWMQPGAPPTVSQATADAELILGGRFVMTKFHGSMFGQPFEGIQILGYDNLQQKYTTFWIDNSSTVFYLMSGARDTSGSVVNQAGMWPDPMSGGTIAVRDVTRVVSPDEYTYELFMTGPDGKEFKTLENRVSRKK
jgi:hypothetical protein